MTDFLVELLLFAIFAVIVEAVFTYLPLVLIATLVFVSDPKNSSGKPFLSEIPNLPFPKVLSKNIIEKINWRIL